VLDEDEFARKLIPELFKHNNYASFVRQLNMYGFHKKVGLSDNSMKASENKRKTPSEYYNKYFKRGRPELLWLIQKPKNPPTAKRKREEKSQGDSDDDQRATPVPRMSSQANAGPSNTHTDVTVLPRTELNNLRQELSNLQKQQKMITQVIQQMKQQNDQFYRQATAFQEMHQRHENSINAILTFLATFYNRSLEGQNNMNEMFSPSLPQGSVQPGNIVDIGDVPEELHMPTRRQKQQLLLPAPETKSRVSTPTSPATVHTHSTVSPKSRNASIYRNSTSTTTTPTPIGNAPSPSPVKHEVESPNMVTDNQGMMSVINAANSASPKTAPGLDFDSALHHFQNADGNTPLTQQQRNDMLSLMQATMGSPGGERNTNSALTNPQIPPIPSLDQISAQNDQLDYLQRLTQQQGENVEHLRERIHSLSPSGYFPALDNSNNPPPDFNLDDWMLPPPETGDFGGINFDDLNDGTGDFGTQNLNNDDAQFDGHHGFLSPEQGENYQGGKVESLSSRASTASPREASNGENEVNSPRKKRKGN
jgi:heat shock transcription factor